MLELFFSTVYETAHADIIESWKTEEKAGICTAVATFSQLTAKQCRLIHIHSGKFVFGILVSTVPFQGIFNHRHHEEKIKIILAALVTTASDENCVILRESSDPD